MIIEGCAVATVSGAVHREGHIVVGGNRITAVGRGPAPSIYSTAAATAFGPRC